MAGRARTRLTWENVARALAAVVVLGAGTWLTVVWRDVVGIREAQAETGRDVAVLKAQAERMEELERRVGRIDRHVTRLLVGSGMTPEKGAPESKP